jgi:hypothetical protein
VRRAWLALGGIAALALGAIARDAGAQRMDPRRPTVLVVGRPPGSSPMHRIDARRSGLSRTPLPTGTLHVAWQKTTGLTLDQPALSGADGTLAVVSVRGDVTFLDEEGEERATVKVGATPVGHATMTSDGTVVYLTSAGDVVGVRRAGREPRFLTRVGGERNVRAAPLSLDDGGVALATMTDLVIVDAEGYVRARATLPEAPDAPLLAARDEIVAVARSGAVYGWAPGREPVRLGSFGGPIDGGAVLTDGGALLAVVDGTQLAEVDLARGSRSTRSSASAGLYLGPPAVRPGPDGAPATTLLALSAARGFVLTLDPAGRELVRASIATFTPISLPDGGAPPITAPQHVGPIVDADGAIAFAATDGRVGVVRPEGAIDTIGEVLCSKGARSGIVGLTPFGRNAFAVTCEGGVVVRVTGTAEPLRRPPP